MPWQSSTRAQRLPAGWARIRAAIIKRDAGRCRCPGCPACAGTPCATPGRDVDHVIPGDDHRPSNLRLLCVACHKRKTARESGRARQGKAYLSRSIRYPTSSPPGLL